MTLRLNPTAAALACALALASCKGGDEKTTTAELVGISASSTSVFANGANTVSLHVTTTGSGPITVTTDRGTFQDSGTTATSVPGNAGDVVLVTCNAITTPSCAGVARVTAARPGTSSAATVTFGGLSLCASNCAADASCVDYPCSSAGVPSGFCTASACALPPTVTIAPSRATALANGVNTVSVDVTTTSGGPVTVTTTRGTFPGGVQSAVVAGASGTLVLSTCDAAASTTCAGTALLTATDRTGTSKQAQVTFGTIALCASDCTVDASCLHRACSSQAVPSGFCSASACAPPPTVTVTPSRPNALANGVNTVDLQVTTTGNGPVSVTTSRGAFPGGASNATLSGSSGNLVLTTCNASLSPGCVGTAVVTATDPTGTSGSGQVVFGDSSLCASDCAVDLLACASHACSSATRPSGICIAGTCAPIPVVTVTPSSTSVLADGTNSVALAVATTGSSGPITVSTNRGTLTGGGTTATVNGTSGSLTLTSCNSVGAVPGCAGSATVTATDPTGMSGTAAIAFVDVDDGAAITVTPGRARLPADGANATPIVVRVTRNGAAAAGVAVTLSADLGTLSATSATTGNDGTATVTFTASAIPGAATIGAAMTSAPSVSASTTVTMPTLGPIQIGSVQYSVMGVRGSSYRELSALTFAVLDDQGRPYPDGLLVHFEHVPLAGSSIFGSPANDPAAVCSGPPGCVAYDGVTDAGGIARVNLSSGTTAGTLIVTASATAGGIFRTFTAPNVAVVGAKASGGSFSIVCSPRNVPALTETNCSTSEASHRFDCEALLKDRFGNLLGTQTQVTFLAEAGSVGPPTTTPAYTPGTPQADLGMARQYFTTLGASLPADVATVPGEPAAAGLDSCGRSRHPRNGVVTVIAVADGEEAFVDLNGNGAYDGPGSTNLPSGFQASGEPFIDLGEPFVDANDNGQWDLGEPFLDVNLPGNTAGQYDGPSGVWDSAGKIWTQTVVVYTGNAESADDGGGLQLGTRWVDGATLADACVATAPATPFALRQNEVASYGLVASDRNLNRLASSVTFAVGKAPATAPITVARDALVRPLNTTDNADHLGFDFQYSVCDATGVCSNTCSPAAASGVPCTMRPVITAYRCGSWVQATVTGPTTAATVATSCDATWDVTTTYFVYGNTRNILLRTPLTGTVIP